jgi:single-stranded-DNA-specific exonuclease
MNKFIVCHTIEPDNNLPVHPLLQRIYAARGVCSSNELQKKLELLNPAITMLNIELAVDLLHKALLESWRILILADYDADGATSCALAVRVLRAMGASYVSYRVPNRFEHGYGLTPEIVAVVAEEKPDLLITVDNGISSHAGVQAAHALGIKVLVTDHHHPGNDLPNAEVIVNPNQLGDLFPSKNIAGVGVIFYVLAVLRTRLREIGWFKKRNLDEIDMRRYLDLVAFGTVADVVRLDHNNRILVEQGLQRIRNKKCIPGITELCKVVYQRKKRPEQDQISASDIGFHLAPLLNAAGRLEDMSKGIECLLSDDLDIAHRIALDLDNINQKRGELTTEIEQQALEKLELLTKNGQKLPFGLCLFDNNWHQGVVGIIAGRLKDHLSRPVIVFAPDRDGKIKGSGRSVAKIHLRDILATVAARHQSLCLIGHFGGHAMAAGLSLSIENFDQFAQAFDMEIRCFLSEDDLQGRLLSDGGLTPDELNVETAKLLKDGGPWGQGFSEPLFDGVFDVISFKEVAKQTLQLELRPQGTDMKLKAVAFKTRKDVLQGKTSMRIAYHLDINRWEGNETLQLRIEHIEPID